VVVVAFVAAIGVVAEEEEQPMPMMVLMVQVAAVKDW
jgi:hypothetical protein